MQQSPAAPVSTVELPSFTALVKKEGPAVVNVSTMRTVSPSDIAQMPGGELPPSDSEEFEALSLGSGFIISQDGYIVTNAHVVEGTDEATVKLTNKREYRAKVIGVDTRTDVALIKIDAAGLPVVPIGDPNKLEVGEWVAAIGAPFGFENSVTSGIVSAKGRALPDESYVPFIQTDVAVNPGNSGGPLFNMRGEVIGVNSQIYSRTGGFMGLSFSIPIDIVMDVVKQLRATGRVTRGRLGVQAQELTVELATAFGLKDATGALIAVIDKGSPADKAGLGPGDVILALNGKPVQDPSDLARMIADSKPGTTINIDVWHKNARKTIQATVAELPPERPIAKTEAPQSAPPPNRAGLTLGELTPLLRSRLKIDHGLLVRHATGPAERAGIDRGDVVLAINDTPVDSVKAFEDQLARSKDGVVALLVRRGPDTLYVPLKLK